MKNSQIIISVLIVIVLFKKINCCEKDKPIKKGGTCQLIYCNENDFNQICEIDNEIVKTQWLTKKTMIHKLGKGVYLSLALTSKGDLLAESSCYKADINRFFYGIKQNGRGYFFNESNDETYYNNLNEVVGGDGKVKGRFESITFVMNYENDKSKEALVSIGKENQNIEIYNFETKNVVCRPSNEEFYLTIDQTKTNLTPFLHIWNSFKLSSAKNNQYIIGTLVRYQVSSIDYFKFCIMKLVLKTESENIVNKKNCDLNCSKGEQTKITSCFETDSLYFMCFFELNKKFKIAVFDSILTKKLDIDKFDNNVE